MEAGKAANNRSNKIKYRLEASMLRIEFQYRLEASMLRIEFQ